MKEMKPAPAAQDSSDSRRIRVKGIDNLLVRFARCCNPVPGDDDYRIYYARTRRIRPPYGLSRTFRSGADGEEAARVIEVEWEETVEANYSVDIEITGHDRRDC